MSLHILVRFTTMTTVCSFIVYMAEWIILAVVCIISNLLLWCWLHFCYQTLEINLRIVFYVKFSIRSLVLVKVLHVLLVFLVKYHILRNKYSEIIVVINLNYYGLRICQFNLPDVYYWLYNTPVLLLPYTSMGHHNDPAVHFKGTS